MPIDHSARGASDERRTPRRTPVMLAVVVALGVAPARPEERRPLAPSRWSATCAWSPRPCGSTSSRGPGTPLDEATVDRDVRAIYGMGFFDQVTRGRRRRSRRTVLRFVVEERPLVRSVTVEGAETVERDEVEAALRIRPHMILDPRRMREGIAAVRKLYADKGHLDASIEVKRTEAPEHEVDLVYVIDEGDAVRVREIRVEGNEAFSDRKLRGLMQTKKRSLLSRFTGAGNLNRDVLRTDMERLTAWYYENGYVTVRIDEPRVERDDDGLVVTVKVAEGPRFTVGSVTIADAGGETPIVPGSKDLDTKAGDTFRAGALRDDVQRLVDRLSDQGYAFAEVEPETAIDVEAQEVDVAFKRRARAAGVGASDRDHGQPEDARRGRPARDAAAGARAVLGDRLRKSRSALQRIGFFRDVTVSTRKTGEPDAVDVVVDLTEGQTGSFSAGAGFSSADALLLNVQIQENNLFGRGQRMVFNVDLGTIRRNVVLALHGAVLPGDAAHGGVDAFSWRLRFDGFDRSGTGFGVNASYPVTGVGVGRAVGDVARGRAIRARVPLRSGGDRRHRFRRRAVDQGGAGDVDGEQHHAAPHAQHAEPRLRPDRRVVAGSVGRVRRTRGGAVHPGGVP
jgi:outer membrane protein insertion porin family